MSSSPYAKTPVRSFFQDKLVIRPVPAYPDDPTYTIEPQYTHRPDLLAFDLYKNSNLWWVFQARNPNAFEDAIWDFRVGTKFYIPKQDTINTALGI